MTKKILLSFITTILSISFLGASPLAYAVDSKILFDVDCNTLNKDVLVGFQSDPADPANGEEIIAFEFTVNLEPVSGSVLTDLAAAKFEPNTSYSNLIVAQNTSNVVANARQLKVAGGFTQQTGLNNVPDLFSITGINQKSYKITVEDAKLFPKSGGDDIYVDTAPKQSFTADPSSCTSTTNTNAGTQSQAGQENVVIENFAYTPTDVTIKVGETVVWTNNDSTDHTVTSIGAGQLDSGTLAPGESYQKTFTEVGTFSYKCSIHPSMTGRVIVEAASSTGTGTTGTSTSTQTTSTTAVTGITIVSDKDKGGPGDEIKVTATITNLKGSIDWSQTAGNRIQPKITNKAINDNQTESVLSFTMPTPANNVTLRLKVADKTETISIQGTDTVTTNAASTDNNTTADTGLPATNVTESDTGSLRDRLEAATNTNTVPQNPTGTLHAAAGGGLARSGPEHTFLLLGTSAILALAYRRKKATADGL